MLSSSSYSEKARQFAARYAENDLQKTEELMVARLEEILAPGWKRRQITSPLKASGEPLIKPALPEIPSQKPEEKAYSVSMVQRSEAGSKPAQVAVPAGSNKLLDQALDYHRNGRIEEAAQIYASLLKDKPDNPIVLHLMGVVRLQLRDFEKAVELISRAVQLHPGEASYYSNLGEAYRNLGQYEQATECLLTALRLKPDYPEACNNLALSLQAQGKHAAALARFQEAVKYNPRYVMAYNNLGRLYGELGQLEQSRACFEQARRAAQNP
jgi:tetratricopeptide (TPR) repeat protein